MRIFAPLSLATLPLAGAFLPLHPSTSFGTSGAAAARPLRATATLDGRDIDNEFTPINNYLLVKTADVKDETEGGIFLTGKAKITKNEGMVVAVGPGRTEQSSGIEIKMPVVAGETAVYSTYAGTEIDYNGAKHILISDMDVMVKFSGDELTLENADVIYDSVLVKTEKKEEDASSAGILFAKTSDTPKKATIGEVVKVGPGKMASNGQMMEMDVAVGDFVKFREFSSAEVAIGDDEYSIVKMIDILAKF